MSDRRVIQRAEQLRRWEESETNKQPASPKAATKIQFSTDVMFLAACAAGDKEDVQRFLKMGMNIDTQNIDGLTALHQACITNNFDMVEFLVKLGADVNCSDNDGWTPLHATASCGFVSISRFLLENGANVAAVGFEGELPIDIADNDTEMQRLLKKAIREADIDCAVARNLEYVTLLKDAKSWASNGCVPPIVDKRTGGSPLHVAAAKGYITIVKILLVECHMDVNIVDYEGWSPLHAACYWNHKEVIEALLRKNADFKLKNRCGQTCLDLVDVSIYTWMETTLLKHEKARIHLNIEKRPRTMKSIREAPVTAADDLPVWRRTGSLRVKNNDMRRTESTNDIATDEIPKNTTIRRANSFNDTSNKSPENKALETKAPETKAPEIKAPEIKAPETKVPETKAPETKVPENKAIETNDTESKDITLRRTFVPPVRDEESETQRKAHAKRVRETRRSTQGVNLDEIKSAEELIKKQAAKSPTTDDSKTLSPTKETKIDKDNAAREGQANVAVSVALTTATATATTTAITTATATATIAANATSNTSAGGQERRPSWRLRVDPTNKFKLENADVASSTSIDATVTLPPPPRFPPATTDNATLSPQVPTTNAEVGKEKVKELAEKKEKDGVEVIDVPSSPSTSGTQNVIQRRRRPKRRSTGVGHFDIDEIVGDLCGNGKINVEEDQKSGPEEGSNEGVDYKALYEASAAEVKRLRNLLAIAEHRLREATAANETDSEGVPSRLISDNERRERRAMERKLSEMEEEVKLLQIFQAENQRLRDENGALIRVISKLSK